MRDYLLPVLLIVAALGALVATSAEAATVFAANNGVDGPSCGAKSSPCRSITQAIAVAAPADKVIVGPGSYGDLDCDGVVGEPGEETRRPAAAACSPSTRATAGDRGRVKGRPSNALPVR